MYVDRLQSLHGG
jgi:hypothetical protein